MGWGVGIFSDSTVPERHLIFYSVLSFQEFLDQAYETIFRVTYFSCILKKPPQVEQPQITIALSIRVIIIYNYFLTVCWLINFNEALSAMVIVSLPGICGINVYPNRNNVVK